MALGTLNLTAGPGVTVYIIYIYHYVNKSKSTFRELFLDLELSPERFTAGEFSTGCIEEKVGLRLRILNKTILISLKYNIDLKSILKRTTNIEEKKFIPKHVFS